MSLIKLAASSTEDFLAILKKKKIPIGTYWDLSSLHRHASNRIKDNTFLSELGMKWNQTAIKQAKANNPKLLEAMKAK